MAYSPSEGAAIVGLVVVAGAETFRAYMPTLEAVRTSDPANPATRQSVRVAEAMSIATIATLSIATAALTDRAAPLFLGLVLVLVMVAGYEITLRQRGAPTNGTQPTAGQ